MRIVIKQYLGNNHSWAVCGRGIARSLAKKHQVDLYSTDGIEHLGDLKKNLLGYSLKSESGGIGKCFSLVSTKQGQIFKEAKTTFVKKGGLTVDQFAEGYPKPGYDLQIGYTMPLNFERYMKYGAVKFGIWCHEWSGKNILPSNLITCFKYVDQLLVPSNFAKQVLLDCNANEKKIKVVPHGVSENFENIIPHDYNMPDTFKIFTNIAQPHKRKNMPALLEAYGKAFTKKDNTCLILKVKMSKSKHCFDDSSIDIINDYNSKYDAKIKIITDYFEDMAPYYAGADACFTMSHCEGYYMPGHEALVSGIMNIAPNYGGQLDFLNNSNSILIDGKSERCLKEDIYTYPHHNATWFMPDIDLAVDALREAKKTHIELNKKIKERQSQVYSETNWDVITDKILSIKESLV